MTMRLDRLELLHQDMKVQGIIKQRFSFKFRTLRFSVVYIAEDFPHTLLFGCISHNLFFSLEVNSDYGISVYLGDNYKPLLNALNLRYDPENRFSPSVFFEAFGQAIPTGSSANNTPTMSDVAILSRDIDEAHKIHFCGWMPHDGVSSNATPGNLKKTLRLCGSNAHKICSQHNISSRWTDDASKATSYYEPNA